MLWLFLIIAIFYFLNKEKNKLHVTHERKCANCGSVFDLQVHHKVPLSLGGKDSGENREILCRLCHEKHHGYKFKDSYEKRNALLVKNRSKKTAILNKAIESGLDVFIVYNVNASAYKNKTARVIHPICLFEKDRKIYVNAFCYLRNSERVFRINRIQSINMVKMKL